MQGTYKPKPNLKKTIDHKLNAKIEYVSCEMQGRAFSEIRMANNNGRFNTLRSEYRR